MSTSTDELEVRVRASREGFERAFASSTSSAAARSMSPETGIVQVDPTVPPQLDRALLESFPVGYRHFVRLQTRSGFAVESDMPGLTGPEVATLYASRSRWLSGEDLDR